MAKEKVLPDIGPELRSNSAFFQNVLESLNPEPQSILVRATETDKNVPRGKRKVGICIHNTGKVGVVAVWHNITRIHFHSLREVQSDISYSVSLRQVFVTEIKQAQRILLPCKLWPST